jgi:hypothetical protein
MRIDEILARMLPGIEERILRVNTEVVDAIIANGWTQKPATPLKRVREADRPIQYELWV